MRKAKPKPTDSDLDQLLERAKQRARTGKEFDACLDVMGDLHAEKKQLSRRAFSYVRFSSVQQAKGGGLKRQTALSEAYCQRKKLTLDDSLSLQDLGVSAFRGDNVREGALAGFLEACRTGRVPRGSYLIVESLDRLSRDQIRPALQLFLALQDFGITIVTLQPEREYPPDATDALALIEPLIVFARAHEESAMKSHRRRHGWQQARDKARQGGGPVMKTCPAWLGVTDDGFVIKEAAAATVRKIFAMACDGLGVHRITERLTRDKVKPIGNKGRWVKNYVWKILSSPAAMGTFQPQQMQGKKLVPEGEPIPGHYPPVVSEAEWLEAQAALESRGGGKGAGRKGRGEPNLFSGLATCALTGERMHLIHAFGRKGKGERKRYVYLCPTQETGAAGRRRIEYAVFEDAILSRLRELKPADIAGDGERTNGREATIARLAGRLLDIDNRLERAKQRARTAGDFDAFLDLIQELQAERIQVSKDLAELRQEEAGQPSAHLGEANSLIDLLRNAPPDQREELRRRLKVRIRQLVTGMHVLIVPRGRARLCAVQLGLRAGQQRHYIILHGAWESAGNGQATAAKTVRPVLVEDFDQAMGAGKRTLDLRKRVDAKKLEPYLQAVDLDQLAAALQERAKRK